MFDVFPPRGAALRGLQPSALSLNFGSCHLSPVIISPGKKRPAAKFSMKTTTAPNIVFSSPRVSWYYKVENNLAAFLRSGHSLIDAGISGQRIVAALRPRKV